MKRLLGLVAVGALVAIAVVLPTPPSPVVADFPEPTVGADTATSRATIWYCPWAEAGAGRDSVFGLVSLQSGAASFTLMPGTVDEEADRFDTFLEGPGAAGVAATEIADRAAVPGYVEFADGPAAAAVAVEDGEFLSADLCLASSPKVWHITGVSTRVDLQTTLRLFNPFPENALVALSGVSEFGIVAMTDIATVDVPSRSWIDVDLDVELPSFDQLALTVRAERGIVLPAVVMENLDDRALWPGSGLSTEWWFPLLAVPGLAPELAVTNPGDQPVEIVIDIFTPEGAGGESLTVSIPPNEPARIALDDLAEGAFGIRIRGDGSVAAVVTAGGDAGLAATTGARAPAEQWLLPGAGTALDAVTSLWLLNPGEEQVTVTILPLGMDPGPADKVILAPGALRQVVVDSAGVSGFVVEGVTPIVAAWSAQAPRGVAFAAGVPVGG
jgi:hypothetical protein